MAIVQMGEVTKQGSSELPGFFAVACLLVGLGKIRDRVFTETPL